MSKKTVLVIDDSAFIRKLLTDIINSSDDFSVIGAAPNPIKAREMIKQLNPDVLTLDVEMPEMDGISFLEKLMRLRPMPVVMVSSLTEQGAEVTMQALELGAIDFVAKPKIDLAQGMDALKDDILQKLRTAVTAKVRSLSDKPAAAKKVAYKPFSTTEKIIAVGSSTGGVEALLSVFSALPANMPGIVIAQHMPPKFTASFAQRLDRNSALKVMEAKDNVRILPGHVYLAEGDNHLLVERSGANYVTRVQKTELVSGHRPSVDVLFHSVANSAGKNSVGIILTGMGHDGAKGLLAMKQTGAPTIGQDEASSVVYGMPKSAKTLGAVDVEVSLSKIPESIINACGDLSARAVRI